MLVTFVMIAMSLLRLMKFIVRVSDKNYVHYRTHRFVFRSRFLYVITNVISASLISYRAFTKVFVSPIRALCLN